MPIQRRTDLLISHFRILFLLPWIVHLEASIWQEAECFSGIAVQTPATRCCFADHLSRSGIPLPAAHRGYLRDVLAGFRPVEMGRVARRMITALLSRIAAVYNARL